MEKQTRDIIINKLGTLQMANAELAAENLLLAKREKDHLAHVEMLKAELARWQQAAAKPDAPAGALDRPEGENLPANTHANGAH